MMADAARSDSARLAALIGEHARLAEAIERRDVEEFESTLLSHLEATYRVTLK